MPHPIVAVTMGDPAGIGPEILARAWPDLLPLARPVVVGDPGWMRRALELTGMQAEVRTVRTPAEHARALALARETDGVTKVIDRIVVQPTDR